MIIETINPDIFLVGPYEVTGSEQDGWLVLFTHPLFGMRVVGELPTLAEAREAVVDHQSREWDVN